LLLWWVLEQKRDRHCLAQSHMTAEMVMEQEGTCCLASSPHILHLSTLPTSIELVRLRCLTQIL
jgi:hypothetical protein